MLPRDDMVFPDVVYGYRDGEKFSYVHVSPADTLSRKCHRHVCDMSADTMLTPDFWQT